MPSVNAQNVNHPGLVKRPDDTGELRHNGQIARVLVKNGVVPVAASSVVAVLMIWVLWGTVATQAIAIWGAFLIAAYGLRLALFHKPASYSHILGLPFLPLFTVLTLLSGLVWGSVGYIFFDPTQIQLQALLAFCLGGLVAGSVVSYAIWPPAFLAFAVPALAPLIYRLMSHPGDVQFAMGGMLLIFGLGLTVMTRTIHRTLRQSLELQFALGNSEGRFRGVFENSPAGMMLMRQNGEIMMVNHAFAQLLGHSRDSLSGRNWREVTHPEDIEAIELLDEQVISGKLPDLLVEKRFLHHDGHTVWTDVATCLIVSPSQTEVYLLRQIFDITALKSVERMKNEFVSTVSHELRTPLTSIDGSLGLVLGGAAGDVNQQARDMILLARNNSQRLISLVNDLLDMDQLESNDLLLRYDLIDVDALVTETVDRNKGMAAAAGVHLRYERRSNPVRVIGDAGRLGQVLTNLLSNAIKFSPPGKCVEVGVRRMEGCIRVSVTDHGSGIPEAFRTNIFNRFSQADGSDSRAKGGAGLGLHISKSIMDKHAGRLDFDSVPGKGATFYFELQEWTGTEPVAKSTEKPRAAGLRPGR